MRSTPPELARRSIFDFENIADFVSAMLTWCKSTSPRFSLRGAGAASGLSHTLVSRIASGQRQLTRDRVEGLAQILTLTGQERAILDRWVAAQRTPRTDQERSGAKRSASDTLKTRRTRQAKNHLLNDWLNVYVKDACKLKSAGVATRAATLRAMWI